MRQIVEPCKGGPNCGRGVLWCKTCKERFCETCIKKEAHKDHDTTTVREEHETLYGEILSLIEAGKHVIGEACSFHEDAKKASESEKMTRDTLTVYVEEEYRRQSQLLMDLREATLAEIDRLCQSDYIKSSFFRMFQQLNQSVTFRQSSTEMIIEEVVKTYHSLSEDLKNLSHFMSKSEHLTSVTYPQIKTGMEVGVTKLTTYEVCAIPRKIDQIESKDHEMTMVYEVLLTGRFAKEVWPLSDELIYTNLPSAVPIGFTLQERKFPVK